MKRPFGLHVTVSVTDVVVLVAAQVAKRTVVVDESFATLMLVIVRDARRQQQRTAGNRKAGRHSRVDAIKVPAEVGNASR